MKGLVLFLCIALAFAAPIQKAPLLQDGDIIPGSYIVTFKKGVDVEIARTFASSVSSRKFWDINDRFIGMAGEWTEEELEMIRSKTDIVELVESNGIARTSARQNNPPSWGLGASSSTTARNPGYYDYPDHGGIGVRVYIIDTGILCTHVDFGSRCVWGARFGTGGYTDGNGHGTHCAGTAAGTSYGIAKNASLIAVGVLGPTGSGSWDDVISGMEYSSSNCGTNFANKCVGSMSLGGSTNTAVNAAANAAVADNYFMAVAAGNNNGNAQNFSPASAADVYTVMATDANAAKASYSNYGAVCSMWAPGSSITSAWSTSNTATNTISGTSMACPHVAGAGALSFGSGRATQGNKFAIENYLNSVGTMNAISGNPAGTVNRFIFVSPAL